MASYNDIKRIEFLLNRLLRENEFIVIVFSWTLIKSESHDIIIDSFFVEGWHINLVSHANRLSLLVIIEGDIELKHEDEGKQVAHDHISDLNVVICSLNSTIVRLSKE